MNKNAYFKLMGMNGVIAQNQEINQNVHNKSSQIMYKKAKKSDWLRRGIVLAHKQIPTYGMKLSTPLRKNLKTVTKQLLKWRGEFPVAAPRTHGLYGPGKEWTFLQNLKDTYSDIRSNFDKINGLTDSQLLPALSLYGGSEHDIPSYRKILRAASKLNKYKSALISDTVPQIQPSKNSLYIPKKYRAPGHPRQKAMNMRQVIRDLETHPGLSTTTDWI